MEHFLILEISVWNVQEELDGIQHAYKEYDRYQGVEELMPRAFAVSAKSHDFDAAGNETHTDYKRMIQIVKNAGFSGYIGVEYEGKVLSEEAGILATKNLLIKTAQELS